MRGAFVFDADRCTGCQACELACSIENDLGAERSWRTVFTFNPGGVPGVPLFHLSLACNHCAEPACMHACPALAYDRDDVTGAVLVDPMRCIGCRYCSWACPYGAPRFEPQRGVMGKCTFCAHRIREGERPACAAYCPTGALDYEVLEERQLEARIDGLPNTRLGPALRILPGVRRERRRTETGTATPAEHSHAGGSPAAEPVIGLGSEWSLAAFTFLLVLLFAGVAAATGGAPRPSPALFAIGVAVAAGLSLAHLGRRRRAWRVILNLRRSWLSREVAGFGAFAMAGLGATAAWDSANGPGLAILAVLVGLALLASVDMVYGPVYTGPSPLLDDGGALLTGVYLAGLFAGDPWIAGSAGAIKLWAVAAGRETVLGSQLRWLAASRVGLGLGTPLAAWMVWGVPLATPVLAVAVCGEALGRAGFYGRLRVVSPELEMQRALAERLGAGSESPSPAPTATLPSGSLRKPS